MGKSKKIICNQVNLANFFYIDKWFLLMSKILKISKYLQNIWKEQIRINFGISNRKRVLKNIALKCIYVSRKIWENTELRWLNFPRNLWIGPGPILGYLKLISPIQQHVKVFLFKKIYCKGKIPLKSLCTVGLTILRK